MKTIEKGAKDKESPMSEDDRKDLEGRVQKMTDAAIKRIEEAVAAKSKELTTV